MAIAQVGSTSTQSVSATQDRTFTIGAGASPEDLFLIGHVGKYDDTFFADDISMVADVDVSVGSGGSKIQIQIWRRVLTSGDISQSTARIRAQASDNPNHGGAALTLSGTAATPGDPTAWIDSAAQSQGETSSLIATAPSITNNDADALELRLFCGRLSSSASGTLSNSGESEWQDNSSALEGALTQVLLSAIAAQGDETLTTANFSNTALGVTVTIAPLATGDTAEVTATAATPITAQVGHTASETTIAVVTATAAVGVDVVTDHVTAYSGTDGLVATPLLQLGTRAPLDRRFPPVEAPYLFDATVFQLLATPGPSHDMQFTGSFRIELDVILPENEITTSLVRVKPDASPHVRLEITTSLTTATLVLGDATGVRDSQNLGAAVQAESGNGARLRLAVAYDTSTTTATVERGELLSDDLASTIWTTFGTQAGFTYTSLFTTQCDWTIGKDAKFIQMRVFDDAAGSNLISDVVAADGASSTVVDRIPTLDWDYQTTATLHPYGDWEDITSPVRYQSGIKTKRGRSTDLGNMNAGSMSATLDDLTRDFEPEFTGSTYYPSIAPFTPVRFLADYLGALLPIWRGFVRTWTPAYNNLDAVTQIQCVDGFRPLNLEQTGQALTAAITDLAPVGFWPMTETAGTTLADSTANSNDLATSGSPTLADSQVTFGDRRPVPTWDGVAGATDVTPGSELLITGDISFVASIVLSTPTTAFTICGPSKDSNNYMHFGLTDTTLRMDRNSGSLETTAVSIPDVNLADGNPHIIAGTYDASTRALTAYVDGRAIDPVTAATAITPVLTSGTFDAIKTSFGSSSIYEGGLGFLAVWDRVLTDFEATTLTAPKLDGSAEGFPGVRIDDLLDLGEWPDNERSIETGTTTLVAKDATDTQVLAEIQTSETADIGEFFIAANGYATYRARGWRASNKPTAEAIFGDNGSTELPYTNLAFDFNETRIINHWETTPADGDTAVAVDLVSIRQYGRRKQTQTLDLLDGDASQTYADNRLAARKDPDLLVRGLNIAVSRDAAHLLPVLLSAEISDRYTIIRRPPGGGDPITNDVFVESISIVCRSETEWYFTLELSPLL